jgi:hypothetical protein
MILYRKIVLVQIASLTSSFVILYFASIAEQKRGAFIHGDLQLAGQPPLPKKQRRCNVPNFLGLT